MVSPTGELVQSTVDLNEPIPNICITVVDGTAQSIHIFFS